MKFPLTSLSFISYDGLSMPQDEHVAVSIFGPEYMEEIVLGRRFRISPKAFFQVNTPGAESLFTIVRDFIKGNNETDSCYRKKLVS